MGSMMGAMMEGLKNAARCRRFAKKLAATVGISLKIKYRIHVASLNLCEGIEVTLEMRGILTILPRSS